MDIKESVKQEKIYGTHNRNKLIRLQHEHGVPQVVIARKERMTKQRVWQIIHKRDKLNWFRRLLLLLGG